MYFKTNLYLLWNFKNKTVAGPILYIEDALKKIKSALRGLP